ncbi:LacI family DNA-binding transcriptional regulator [Modestobacter sp. I12A-02628]|uniref:Substrate-binding domain-containing protein n=1 Tax=Goekera deserti TaxID=2497753 RepID=A0A7K3WFP3_9ACTN|nr:LacI family DNA-binding transcriptional regulator [Goekera deserti]MPR00045.1 LacI family DNA-binding transcriptional regulator [Goekera deserti]NDI49824.1 substrate-binding domain-containing protein [Goekera deserti]NEL55186.1 substrate-binding domain-containing protein [Goekera deserti]
MRQRARLEDVAARAGVSPSTASVALSGAGRVAAATRARVQAAAAELGYSPDPVAASLRSGRSGVVGAVVGERLLYAFRDPVAVQLLDGLTEELSRLDVGLLLLAGDAMRSGPSPAQLSRLPLDAAVFATCGLEDDPAFTLLQARGVPLVAVEGPVAAGVPLIAIDDERGSAELARHLQRLGHARVVVVTLPMRLDGRRGPVDAERLARGVYRDARRRLVGLRSVLPGAPAVEAAGNSVEEGEAAARLVLDVPAADRPTALVAQSDVLAAGALRAAADLGLQVPGDLSVAGFDGADLPWLAPVRLTTVVQPTAAKGRAAGHAVAELLAGRTPADVELPVELRPGTTTGPVPPG